MKNAMHDNTVEFIFETGRIMRSIVLDRINTDEQVTRKDISITIIESNNVSIIIVLQILLIYIKKVAVRTKNNVDIANGLGFCFRNKLKPSFADKFVGKIKFDVLGEKSNHNNANLLLLIEKIGIEKNNLYL